MDKDSVTTTTTTSWTSRLGNALTGILFGLILFLGSFLVLTLNEGRAINRSKTLDAGASLVAPVPAARVDPANQGRLVHVTGNAEARSPVSDPAFDITATALKLRRSVEMYQWEQSEKSETKQKVGGGEETQTTYSYAKTWSAALIDSTRFQLPAGHENPASMPVKSATFVAEGIHVGAFDLPASLTDRIDNFENRPVTPAEAAAAQQGEPPVITTGGMFFIGKDPQTPAIGDLRISFEVAPPGTVSIVAGQTGNTFEPFAVGKSGTIELLKTGTFSAGEMFRQEQETNTVLTWILRLVGFLMMLIGLMMIAQIFSVAASAIPFLGNIVGIGTTLMAFAVALPLSLITIAVAWIAYRPIVAIPLLLLAGGSAVFGVLKLRGKPRPAPSRQ